MEFIKFSSSQARDYKEALRIRRTVFIEEQKVPEEIEIDEFEDSCTHFLIYEGAESLGAARLRVKGPWIKFERIAVLEHARGKGVGRALVEKMMAHAKVHFPHLTPMMNSQLSAEGFYQKLGWKPQGEVFHEAGIPHIQMVITSSEKSSS